MNAESPYLPWSLAGTYLEACNCEVICPCRTIGGEKGGRSSFGVCMGTLSWKIEHGGAGPVGLGGLNVVLALRYSDEEPGSPWSFVLYLDRRGDREQRQALEQIFLGKLAGTPERQFPWVWKPSDLLGVRAVDLEVDHTPGRGWFKAKGEVAVRISRRVDQPKVTCVIPGHHREGSEVQAELLSVGADGLDFEFRGRCGYESSFSYSSADSKA
jgi:hypothetical protein